MNLEQARFYMIEQQLRPARVLDERTLELLNILRREEFVPAAWRHLAYAQTEIPLGHNARMFTPLLEAQAIQALKLRAHENVLEIGSGSGFMAALLAVRAKQVHTIEIEPELAALAQGNLQRVGLRNVEVQIGDGLQGLPAQAPFDVIMVSGGVAEIPSALLDQLKPGGRLFAITGTPPAMQAVRVHRQGTQFHSVALFETVVDYLRNAEPHPGFEF